MSLRIALVGCGKIADGHVEEIRKMGARAEVVAVCDREILMAEQLAVRYGLPDYYGDYERMMEKSRPDVVHITTPPQSHLPLALQAIEAGCHVYVEKPLTLSLGDTQILVEAAEDRDRKLTVGYSYHFSPVVERMRSLIARGTIGEVIHIESFQGYPLSGPFGSAVLADGSHWVHRLPGKLFHNNIDHMLCRVVEFLDEGDPSIKATAYVRRERMFGDMRDRMPDELRLMIQGRRTSVYGTFSSHVKPLSNFLRIYGTRNSLHLDFENQTVVLESSAKLPSALGRLLPPFQHGLSYLREGLGNVRRFARSECHYFAGLNQLISRFYDSILYGTDPPIAYSDIVRVSGMMEEIFSQIGDRETAGAS